MKNFVRWGNVVFALVFCWVSAKVLLDKASGPNRLPPVRTSFLPTGAVWQREVPHQLPVLHVVSDNERIYFESASTDEFDFLTPTTVHGVDSKNGKLLWNLPLRGEYVTSLTAAPSQALVCITTHHKVLVVRAETGRLVWRQVTGMTSGPAKATFHRGRLSVACNNGSLWCFDAANGRTQWYIPVGIKAVSKPVVTDAGVFVACGGDVYRLKLADGAMLWGFYAQDDNPGELAADDAGRLFLASWKDGLVAFGQADGKQLWRRELHQATGPVVQAGRILIEGDIDGKTYLFCLASDSGRTLWRKNGECPDVSSPGIVGDRLLVGWGDTLETPSWDGKTIRTRKMTGTIHTPLVSGDVVCVPAMNGSHQSFLTVFPVLSESRPPRR